MVLQGKAIAYYLINLFVVSKEEALIAFYLI